VRLRNLRKVKVRGDGLTVLYNTRLLSRDLPPNAGVICRTNITAGSISHSSRLTACRERLCASADLNATSHDHSSFTPAPASALLRLSTKVYCFLTVDIIQPAQSTCGVYTAAARESWYRPLCCGRQQTSCILDDC